VSRLLGWWRHAAIAGLAAGLLLAPHLAAPQGWLPCGLAATLGLVVGWREVVGAAEPQSRIEVPYLLALAAVAALLGLGVGTLRVGAIDAGALRGQAGEPVEVIGHVTAVPTRSWGEVRVQLDTPDGRVVAVAPEPVGDLPVGAEVAARGRLAVPDEFRAAELEREGAAFELRTRDLVLTGASRGGLQGALDRIRLRAESPLGKGVQPDQAALARGFVLGADDRIDPLTSEQFRRAGLSHLLAVSGQNVILLALLAGTALALFGVGLRTRLLITVLLIAVYVPVAGGGPSIQRAGIMGAAAIVATLAGRPSDRAYPPLLAAAATLLINPRFGSDVGWQLSFAAVVGIMLWAGPLRELTEERLSGNLPKALARGLGEGIAVTLAATVATAPLIAHDFERLSLASIPANLLVLVAVAPVMWMGMLIAMLGQLPGLPPPFLGSIEGHLLDYVASVAKAFGSPSWAQAEVSLPAPAAVMAIYLLISVAACVLIGWLRRRRGLGFPRGFRVGAAAAVLAALLAIAPLGAGDGSAPPRATLTVVELDVGQGDATLLQPPRGAPVLVDAGPPGGAAAAALADRGIDRLRAIFISHDELDHVGGLSEVLATAAVDELAVGRRSTRLEAAARAGGARVVPIAEGSSLRFGGMRIDVLWPPRERVEQPIAEANDDSLVLAARFDGYDALLTGDAEAEATHLDPGPFDVLKVAHHGSEDAGLPALLDHSVPRVALIGVGAGNPYGHPTPETLRDLADHGVCTLRTDLNGAITVELGPDGVGIETERGSPTAGAGCVAATTG
jgi:competence protein ComEC